MQKEADSTIDQRALSQCGFRLDDILLFSCFLLLKSKACKKKSLISVACVCGGGGEIIISERVTMWFKTRFSSSDDFLASLLTVGG